MEPHEDQEYVRFIAHCRDQRRWERRTAMVILSSIFLAATAIVAFGSGDVVWAVAAVFAAFGHAALFAAGPGRDMPYAHWESHRRDLIQQSILRAAANEEKRRDAERRALLDAAVGQVRSKGRPGGSFDVI